jgi:hypothetical protein
MIEISHTMGGGEAMASSLDTATVVLVTIAATLAIALLVLYEIRVGLRLFREIRSLLRQLRD